MAASSRAHWADRRHHGEGDNTRNVVHAKLPHPKQAANAAVKVATAPHPAAIFHTAVATSRGMAKVPAPGRSM